MDTTIWNIKVKTIPLRSVKQMSENHSATVSPFYVGDYYKYMQNIIFPLCAVITVNQCFPFIWLFPLNRNICIKLLSIHVLGNGQCTK